MACLVIGVTKLKRLGNNHLVELIKRNNCEYFLLKVRWKRYSPLLNDTKLARYERQVQTSFGRFEIMEVCLPGGLSTYCVHTKKKYLLILVKNWCNLKKFILNDDLFSGCCVFVSRCVCLDFNTRDNSR